MEFVVTASFVMGKNSATRCWIVKTGRLPAKMSLRARSAAKKRNGYGGGEHLWLGVLFLKIS